jgi:NADPH:quinone reductase-like Zn-dependent oxidoreductase
MSRRPCLACTLAVRRVALLTLLGSALSATANATPSQMHAIVERGTGGPDVMHFEQVPVPQPGPGEVRIRVYAAGVNPADWEIRIGMFGPRRPAGAASPPVARQPGLEVAGVIDAVGAGVSRWQPGQAVYGLVAAPSGAFAQYALARADAIARKPRRLTYAEAAGAPVGWLTALRTLEDAHVHSGERVVVIGAAGGVGSAAVQIAKARGATVIAVASSRHDAFLQQIGADRIVNYDRGEKPEAQGADVVVNTAPGQTLAALADVKRGGVLVSIVAPPPAQQCQSAGVSCPSQMGRNGTPVSVQLTQLARLADEGRLSVHVEKTFPLEQAAAAEEFNRAGHAEGKVVLVVSPQAATRR